MVSQMNVWVEAEHELKDLPSTTPGEFHQWGDPFKVCLTRAECIVQKASTKDIQLVNRFIMVSGWPIVPVIVTT